ncbi:MAG: ABC transporter permease [Spirochaetaceae bacterium]|nr:ABC transporter permease [Spirochaetaceae bacterium]
MIFLVTLAFKNLARHKRRTLITAGAIAVGIMMYIFIDSMLEGADVESVRNMKWYETSSARIYHEDYWDNRFQKPLDIHIVNPDLIVRRLINGGFPAAKRIEFAGDMILGSDDFGVDGNMSVVVTAIDPEKDFDVFHFKDTLIQGRFLEEDEDAIVMGSWFAEDIGAEIGHWITIVTRGYGGFFEAMDLEIVGIVNCPNPNVNRTLIMMPFDTADEYLAMDGASTEINIKISGSQNQNEDIAAIENILKDSELNVLSWRELASDYLANTKSDRAGSALILLLIVIIASVGISNTMLMVILERTKELGMMSSMGMSEKRIRATFLIEAAGIGLVGSLLGVALGILADLFLIYVGIDYGFMMRDLDLGYRIQAIFRGVWNPGTMTQAFFAGIFISAAVAFLPIERALKMDITSCLKHL